MKKLGILGGMGPESTLLYYKLIVSEYQRRDKEGFFPALTIETVNMYEMLRYCQKGQYDKLADYLLRGIYNLERAGADFAVLASNTPHVVFEILEQKSHIPLLSILEPTSRAMKANQVKKAVWLGTRFTMENNYFRNHFADNGINIVIPNEGEREVIDTIIAKELEFGIINVHSKNKVDCIIKRLIEKEHIQAVIMGCTELPLLYENAELLVPVYNTLQYHIQGIVSRMFEA